MTVTELWRVKDIAEFGKWAETYTAQYIVTLPGFPRPVRVTGPNAKPRWISDQVREFVANLASSPYPQQTERSRSTGT